MNKQKFSCLNIKYKSSSEENYSDLALDNLTTVTKDNRWTEESTIKEAECLLISEFMKKVTMVPAHSIRDLPMEISRLKAVAKHFVIGISQPKRRLYLYCVRNVSAWIAHAQPKAARLKTGNVPPCLQFLREFSFTEDSLYTGLDILVKFIFSQFYSINNLESYRNIFTQKQLQIHLVGTQRELNLLAGCLGCTLGMQNEKYDFMHTYAVDDDIEDKNNYGVFKCPSEHFFQVNKLIQSIKAKVPNLSNHMTDLTNQLQHVIDAPSNLIISGRPKSGKSQLVNTLLQHKLIPTSSNFTVGCTIKFEYAATLDDQQVSIHYIDGAAMELVSAELSAKINDISRQISSLTSDAVSQLNQLRGERIEREQFLESLLFSYEVQTDAHTKSVRTLSLRGKSPCEVSKELVALLSSCKYRSTFVKCVTVSIHLPILKIFTIIETPGTTPGVVNENFNILDALKSAAPVHGYWLYLISMSDPDDKLEQSEISFLDQLTKQYGHTSKNLHETRIANGAVVISKYDDLHLSQTITNNENDDTNDNKNVNAYSIREMIANRTSSISKITNDIDIPFIYCSLLETCNILISQEEITNQDDKLQEMSSQISNLYRFHVRRFYGELVMVNDQQPHNIDTATPYIQEIQSDFNIWKHIPSHIITSTSERDEYLLDNALECSMISPLLLRVIHTMMPVRYEQLQPIFQKINEEIERLFRIECSRLKLLLLQCEYKNEPDMLETQLDGFNRACQQTNRFVQAARDSKQQLQVCLDVVRQTLSVELEGHVLQRFQKHLIMMKKIFDSTKSRKPFSVCFNDQLFKKLTGLIVSFVKVAHERHNWLSSVNGTLSDKIQSVYAIEITSFQKLFMQKIVEMNPYTSKKQQYCEKFTENDRFADTNETVIQRATNFVVETLEEFKEFFLDQIGLFHENIIALAETEIQHEIYFMDRVDQELDEFITKSRYNSSLEEIQHDIETTSMAMQELQNLSGCISDVMMKYVILLKYRNKTKRITLLRAPELAYLAQTMKMYSFIPKFLVNLTELSASSEECASVRPVVPVSELVRYLETHSEHSWKELSTVEIVQHFSTQTTEPVAKCLLVYHNGISVLTFARFEKPIIGSDSSEMLEQEIHNCAEYRFDLTQNDFLQGHTIRTITYTTMSDAFHALANKNILSILLARPRIANTTLPPPPASLSAPGSPVRTQWAASRINRSSKQISKEASSSSPNFTLTRTNSKPNLTCPTTASAPSPVNIASLIHPPKAPRETRKISHSLPPVQSPSVQHWNMAKKYSPERTLRLLTSSEKTPSSSLAAFGSRRITISETPGNETEQSP